MHLFQTADMITADLVPIIDGTRSDRDRSLSTPLIVASVYAKSGRYEEAAFTAWSARSADAARGIELREMYEMRHALREERAAAKATVRGGGGPMSFRRDLDALPPDNFLARYSADEIADMIHCAAVSEDLVRDYEPKRGAK